MILIGLSGKKQSGKNTVAKLIATMTSLSCQEFAFADELKKEVAKLCGVVVPAIEQNKLLYRELLQAWGCYKRNICGKDYWIEGTFRKILSSTAELLIITDVRFLNEASSILLAGGNLVRVERFTDNDKHISETELDTHIFEHIIDNRSTLDDLSQQVKGLLKQLTIPIKQ